MIKSNIEGIEIKNGKGQITGVIDDRVLRIIKSTSHIVRKFRGLGVSLDTLQAAQELGASIVEFRFFENSDQYSCLITEYINWAHRDSLGGYEVQLFLPLKSFKYSVLHKKQPEYAGEWSRNNPKVEVQGKLF